MKLEKMVNIKTPQETKLKKKKTTSICEEIQWNSSMSKLWLTQEPERDHLPQITALDHSWDRTVLGIRKSMPIKLVKILEQPKKKKSSSCI